ncbi:putative Mediator of RNA polymerase II transcription subunit 4 [Seiridium cardinale]
MDAQMAARFERVEEALATLIDSVSRYNPTIAQGNELVTADQELFKGLDLLKIHQQNYARIQHLQSITTGLDNQIKDILTQLAQARKELVNTPATSFPTGPSYPINYAELLAYARRISKTTLPNANVLASAQASAADSTAKPDSAAETPAVATPVTGTPNGVGTPAQLNGPAAGTPVINGEPSSQQTSTTLPEGLQAHINPLANTDFIPWPTEDLLRQGALANIQYLTDKGINPQGYDPSAEEARKKQEEEEAKEREEKERLEREENERRYREQRERARIEEEKAREESFRRASVTQTGTAAPGAGPSTSPPQQQKQFQFMGGDDDDDDSDD